MSPIGPITPGGGGGAVSSVFTRTGAVVAASGDYTPAQVGADASGAAAAAQAAAEAASQPVGSSLAVIAAANPNAAAVPMNAQKITGLTNGSAASDAAAFGQVPTPATTVTGPDAIPTAAVVGTSGLFARQDHDHGIAALTQYLLTRTSTLALPATTLTTVLTSVSLPVGYYLATFGMIIKNGGATLADCTAQIVAGTGGGSFNGQGTSGAGSANYNLVQQGSLPAETNGCESLSCMGVLQVTTAGTFLLQAESAVAATVDDGPPQISPLGGTFFCFVKIG